VSKSVGTASNLPFPLTLLPLLASGFVPTDSLPVGLRWFAENQPFTPIIETLRGLLFGTAIGSSGWIAAPCMTVIPNLDECTSAVALRRSRTEARPSTALAPFLGAAHHAMHEAHRVSSRSAVGVQRPRKEGIAG
jgi:hypothetical protein